ncbi:AMP-binding protein, partial [Cribrihabitans sp. XS_ASV171]
MIEAQTQTVWAAFDAAAARWPDRPFLNVLPETAGIYGIEAGEITYADARADAARMADALDAAGIGAGHRVMLLLENRPSFFLWVLALNRLGAAAVPVNPDLRAAELTYMICHAEPVLAVAIPDRCAELRAAADDAGVTMPVIAPEDDIPAPRDGSRIALRDGPA